MLGSALSHKEGLIVALEKELAIEKTRRDHQDANFAE
jgi:hypothetical protein